MIRVWSDSQRAGVLDRLLPRGSTFVYEPLADRQRAISVTMPVRVQSWDVKFGLLPIFEMNLPEGALRERLTRRFAKATGTFDEFDLIAIVGRSQIGRLRYSAIDENLTEEVPFQSIDEILRARRDGDLFNYLLDQFASHSGLSGVQPKVMIRGTGKVSDPKGRQSPSIMSATHIVKLWEDEEYPELAANEFFCLQVAKRLGMPVPNFVLSDDGGALIVDRFDLADGHYLGFEDFCVLNALGTADKYKGGYETRIFRRLREFVAPSEANRSLEDLFRLFLLNCAIRNGDAHLKNFGITYEHVDGPARLAPVYDLVTTWSYVPGDPMALTLDGSTRWPDRKSLIRLAQTRADLSERKAAEHTEFTADAMASVAPQLREYFASREGEVGVRMLAAWEAGIKDSLGLIRGLVPVKASPQKKEQRIAKSDAILLEFLRQKGGSVSGTLKTISDSVGIPQSTLGTSVKRLIDRGFVQRSKRRITLLPREV
ncbi:MAG TPA: HipA domain-containing protein [Hyphomicrobiaceae bacterium]|nr:HipA domain-containing protein [Hyphomicrobiaceae bacterium]